MEHLAEGMDALTARVDALTERVDALTEDVRALTSRIDRIANSIETMNGRLGNLEGWRYEFQYLDYLASQLAPRFRRVKRVIAGNFSPLLSAFDQGLLSPTEWRDAMELDLLAEAREGRAAASPQVYLAIELSVLVSMDDVRRANRRAELIRRAGVDVRAAVDGDAILPEARVLAQNLGVEVLVFDVAA